MQLTQSQEAARERLHGLILDPDNGDPYLTRLCSPNLPRYRRDGLLHQGTREDWGD